MMFRGIAARKEDSNFLKSVSSTNYKNTTIKIFINILLKVMDQNNNDIDSPNT